MVYDKQNLTQDKGISILFSDVIDTLILNFHDLIKKRCNMSVDDASKESKIAARIEEFKDLSYLLNDFLMRNNYLALVTNINHDTNCGVYEMLRDVVTNSIDYQYHHRVLCFISGIYGETRKEYENELTETYGTKRMAINYVGNKRECISIALQKLKEYKIEKMYAVGDSERDFDMLLDVHNAGGESAIIADLNKNFIEETVYESLARYDFYRETRELYFEYKKEHEGSLDGIKDNLEHIMIEGLINDRCLELQKMVETGELNLETLKKVRFLISETLFFKHYDAHRALIEQLKELPFYPDFNSFYDGQLRVK